MTPVRIKICGITRLEDALTAAQLGVDAIGFVFYEKSPRYITPQNAAEIIRALPPFVSRVGVFVNEEAGRIESIVKEAALDTVQLHGSESPSFCNMCSCPVIKAFGLRPDFDLSEPQSYTVAGVLLDTWNHGLQGGTGISGDWELAGKVADRYERTILAGGLGPANIKEALVAVRPYGVDINSGVEIMPGIKNPHKMREVVDIVRNRRETPF